MGKTINYSCPNCGAIILHSVDDNGNGAQEEFCTSCQRTIPLSELQNSTSSTNGGYASTMTVGDAMVTYIDDAESAFAYLENFYETYDWDDFATHSALSIPAVERMVEKMLIKKAANPSTWELQFTAIATPLQKKLGGLKKLESKFFEQYVENDDLADCFVFFDTYSKIVNNIIVSGSEIIKKLEGSIKYHKKYNGEASVNKSMTAQLEAIKKDVAALKPIKDYKELSGFAKAQTEKQNKIVQKLAKQNIDAEQLYTSAVAEAKKGGDVRNALNSFIKIAGYKDSAEYAAKLNGWLRFNMADGAFIKLGNKHYVFRKQTPAALNIANIQNQDKNTEEQLAQDNTKRFDMFEIIDNQQAEKPCARRITLLVTHFGGNLIFVKDGSSICSFDSNAPAESAEKVIFSAKRGEILTDKLFVKDNRLFIQKKLEAVKEKEQGCFAKLFKSKKKPQQEVLTRNNYTLISLDLVNDKLFTVIPEMIDIQDKFGDEIFFTKVTTNDKGEDNEEFLSYNYKTKRTKAVLNADTEIVDVVDGKAIYFVWTPNDYNKDLHSLDLQTGVDKTLDRNVFEYYGTIDKMPYYYIGNDLHKTLYRIDVDGNNKLEISNKATYFDRALLTRNGWIYFANGFGMNVALAKMHTDGTKQIRLCPQFRKLVEIRDGYVYYINIHNNLCCVREDGSEFTTILQDVGNFIQVTRDAIYLLRKEIVDEDNSRMYANNSLYKVDLEGKGLEKIAFNVTNAVTNESDKNEIYLYKTDKVTYSVAIPVSKNQYETTFETKTIKTITVYNIANKTFKDVAILGKPSFGKYEFKGGCLKKKVSKDAIVKEVANKKTFKRSGKAKAGAIANEQIVQSSSEAVNSKNASSTPAKSTNKANKSSKPSTSQAGKVSTMSIVMFIVTCVLFLLGLIIRNTVFNIISIIAFVALIVYSAVMLKKEKDKGKKVDGLRIATIVVSYIAFMTMFFIIVYSGKM